MGFRTKPEPAPGASGDAEGLVEKLSIASYRWGVEAGEKIVASRLGAFDHHERAVRSDPSPALHGQFAVDSWFTPVGLAPTVALHGGCYMRLRAHHLAKQLGVPINDVVRAAETALGLRISNYNVLLRPEQVDAIRASLRDVGVEHEEDRAAQ